MYYVFEYNAFKNSFIRSDRQYLVVDTNDKDVELVSGSLLLEYTQLFKDDKELRRHINIKWVSSLARGMQGYAIAQIPRNTNSLIIDGKFVYVIRQGTGYAWYDGVGIIGMNTYFDLCLNPIRFISVLSERVLCNFNDFINRICLEV